MCKYIEKFNEIENKFNNLRKEIELQDSATKYLKGNHKFLDRINILSCQLNDVINDLVYIESEKHNNTFTIDFYNDKIIPLFRTLYNWSLNIIGGNVKKTLPIIIRSKKLFGEENVIYNFKVLKTRDYITKLKVASEKVCNIVKNFVKNNLGNIIVNVSNYFITFKENHTAEKEKRVKKFNKKLSGVTSILGNNITGIVSSINPVAGIIATAVTTIAPQLIEALNEKAPKKFMKGATISVIVGLTIGYLNENKEALNEGLKNLFKELEKEVNLNNYYGFDDITANIYWEEN